MESKTRQHSILARGESVGSTARLDETSEGTGLAERLF